MLYTINAFACCRRGVDVKSCTRLQLLRQSRWLVPFEAASRGFAQTVLNVFNRDAKRMQKNRTAKLEKPDVYDYVRDEVGFRLYDRINDIKRKFGVCVDLGCNRGHVSKHLTKETVDVVFQCDMAQDVLAQSQTSPDVKTHTLVVDEEFLPFAEKSVDLFVSNLSLHWVNDLPSTFRQINYALKEDGVFIGTMFGGETLFELRTSLQLAEIEREGGFGPHISPMIEPVDVGDLLTRARFSILTVDLDEVVVNYPSMYELMHDLQGMGENNCSWNRKPTLRRDTIDAAAAIYRSMYGNDDGSIPATFQVVNLIGWKPSATQPKPAKRGSQTVSLKDLHKLDDIARTTESDRYKSDS